MDLLVIRHAIAMDREDFFRAGLDDYSRPLTPEGRARMRQVARGLRRLVPKLGIIAASPLARAAQTARILAAAYGMETLEAGALAPSAPTPQLLRWLARRREDSVAVVGHEPHLGGLISLLLTRRPTPLTELRKGGACLLSFSGRPAPGRGALQWLLKPSQLRRLA